MENVLIEPFRPEFKEAFKSLNVEWINTYFELEETDLKALDYPESYILSNGGFIFVATHLGTPIGVCALIRMKDEDFDFEMAKMAVTKNYQGQGIGFLLASAAIQHAKKVGAKSIYLETNSKLVSAQFLYKKLGFELIPERVSPYSRVDIQMALLLT